MCKLPYSILKTLQKETKYHHATNTYKINEITATTNVDEPGIMNFIIEEKIFDSCLRLVLSL